MMQRHYEQKDKSRLEFPSTLAQKQILIYQILAFLRALSSQNIIFLGNHYRRAIYLKIISTQTSNVSLIPILN